MLRLPIGLAAAALFLAAAGVLQGAPFTFSFRPNDLMDLYPSSAAGDKMTQSNARIITDTLSPKLAFETWTTSNNYSAFTPAAWGSSQSTAYNTYMNWRAGLGSGEGITDFNMWVLPSGMGSSYPSVLSWGQNLVFTDATKANSATSMTATSGTAGNGWQYEVVNIYAGVFGVNWWTTDTSKAIRPGGTDLGTFSFTGDLRYDGNVDGVADRDIQAGDVLRVWFGPGPNSYNSQTGTWTKSTLFDSSGWGNTTPAATPYNDEAAYVTFNGVLEQTVVPEPVTLSLLVLGGLGIFATRRRRGV